MYEHHVVGVFGSYEAAEQARSKLKSAGVSDQNIHLSQVRPERPEHLRALERPGTGQKPSPAS